MKRKTSKILAIIIALVLIITGTFAWVNFYQHVKNEFEGGPDKPPGGTTHDDFDPPVKEVYVENWGEVNIYVRIRLDEYMEIGEGAGKKGSFAGNTWVPNPNNKSKPLINGAIIDDMSTWSPHIPYKGQVEVCNTPADFHDYWEWEMGGSKYYMPAPDDKKTNLAYVDQNTKEYKGDEPGVKKTLDATVITMQEWHNLGKPTDGEYWVIDSDGWAYWAAPLRPGDATGLLLNSVKKIFDAEDSYYYAINVIVQMATKFGDFNYENFYDESDSDHKATVNGKELLDLITEGEQKGKQKIPATGVTISGGNKNIDVGEKYKPGCVVEPANSTDKPVWTSSDPSVATVDRDGNITGVRPGEAVITVTAGDHSDTIIIKVKSPLVPATGVTISGGDKTMTVGEKTTLVCFITPADSTDKPLWSSSDSSVASINPLSGVIEALSPGTITITVTAGNKTDSITVKVTNATIPAKDIKIDGGNKNMTVGDKDILTCKITPADSTDLPTWTSDKPYVVTVHPDTGRIEAVGPGDATIKVTAGNMSDSITVKVKAPKIPTVKGESESYDTQYNNDPAAQHLNFALKRDVRYDDDNVLYTEPNPRLDQDGSIKLSYIIADGKYEKLEVRAVEEKYNGHFYIDNDKEGSPALFYNYIPEKSVWDADYPRTPVIRDVQIILSRPDSSETIIKIILRYTGSLYGPENGA